MWSTHSMSTVSQYPPGPEGVRSSVMRTPSNVKRTWLPVRPRMVGVPMWPALPCVFQSPSCQ